MVVARAVPDTAFAVHPDAVVARAIDRVWAIFEIDLGEKADRALIRQYRYRDTLCGFAARELRSARCDAEKLDILRALGHASLAEHAHWILAHRDKRLEGRR